MLAVALAALTGGTDTVAHLIDTVLGRYALNTLVLVLLVAVGTFCLGVGSAWLVTMTRFPRRAAVRGRAGAAAGLSRLCAGLCLHAYP